jgi:hypothetical protein
MQSIRRRISRIVMVLALIVAVSTAVLLALPYQRELRIARAIEARNGDVVRNTCQPSWIPPSVQNRWSFLYRIQRVSLPDTGQRSKDNRGLR